MRHLIVLHPKARKNLEKIPKLYRLKIIETLDILTTEPFLGKKLLGNKKDHYSLRVWPYRIIYYIEKQKLIIFIIDIDHRQGVYK